jgi:hypothetical protein
MLCEVLEEEVELVAEAVDMATWVGGGSTAGDAVGERRID